jgi:hypothetical protein
MAIDYTLNWSDDVLKVPFTLIGGSVDTTSTSLALTGKGYVNWGERLQENLLHLLENFASGGTPPAHPTIGQTWYNDVSKKLSIYHSGDWHVISSKGTTASLGGGYYPIAIDQIVLTGSITEVTLAQFTAPTTGYICVSASVQLIAVTNTPVVNPVIGGPIVTLYRNSTVISNSGMNAAQQAWGAQGMISGAVQLLNPYISVSAGDVVSARASAACINAVSNYKTALSPGAGPEEAFLSYHYL